MRFVKWLASQWHWLLLTLVVAAGAGYYVYSRPAADAQPAGKKGRDAASRVTPVVAQPAAKKDVNVYLTGLGTVTPLKTVTVRSRVDGQLMRVLFREGQLVREGDLLAEIDPRPFQAALTQAEGQMTRDQALLANARIDLERYRVLLAQDSIAKQLVDTQAALVKQYEGTVTIDAGTVDNARLQLAYSRVAAPIPGRLGLRTVDVGNIVRAGDTNGLVVITQLQPITVIYTIAQDNLQVVLQRIKSGDKLPVDAFDRDQKVKLASGILLTVDNQIDTTTGTVKLKAQFPNDDSKLFPNQFVNVRMLIDTRADVTTVPSAALQRGARGLFVYVVKEDRTVTLRDVKTGPTENDLTVIESGIQPGELVVTDGMDRLREGAKVDLPTKDSAGRGKGGDGTGRKGGGRRKGGDMADGDKSGGDKSSGGDKGGASEKSGGEKSSNENSGAVKSDGEKGGGEGRRYKGGRDKAGGDKGAGDTSSGKADADKAADGQKEGGRKRGAWKKEKASE
jgi:multidrug efflux system membrane fusion protein